VNIITKIFVNELKAGDFLTDQVFSVEEIQQHKTRTQQPYYRLILQDRTGEIVGRIWQDDFANCHLRDVEHGDVVMIDAEVNEYNGSLQLTTKKLAKTDNYNIADLVQSSDKDIDTMFAEIQGVIKQINNKDIKKLLDTIFGDEEFANKYKRAPAALMVHHDYVGGLMEHTLEMIGIAKAMLNFYTEANKDLVMSGILLHDIGKVFELQLKKSAFSRTKEGLLHGHVALSYGFVQKQLPKNFPEQLWDKLGHIILSHQGTLELGSPIKPATIEAEIVHMADYSSSWIRQFQRAIHLGEGKDEGFSDYQKWIGTQVYLE
jgi:3'-5' exoribonuclease